MEIISNEREIRHDQGFALYVLRTEQVELAVAPALGARIVSLKNLRTGREWLWHPEGGRKLFRNRLGDDFSRSTLVGADECLPTIAACTWQGRHLPDHGEVWSAAWQVDREAWQKGVLRTFIELAVSPFKFERALTVREHEVQIHYRLTSHSAVEEQYLWAWHPLLRVQAGDRLKLPATTRALLNGETWVDAIATTIPQGGCAKVFAGPLQEGRAGVHNEHSGDGLCLEWNPTENNTLGLWLTRGGWHGHHHLALEPTNGAPDPLALAAERQGCSSVPARGSVSWSLRLQIGP